MLNFNQLQQIFYLQNNIMAFLKRINYNYNKYVNPILKNLCTTKTRVITLLDLMITKFSSFKKNIMFNLVNLYTIKNKGIAGVNEFSSVCLNKKRIAGKSLKSQKSHRGTLKIINNPRLFISSRSYTKITSKFVLLIITRNMMGSAGSPKNPKIPPQQQSTQTTITNTNKTKSLEGVSMPIEDTIKAKSEMPDYTSSYAESHKTQKNYQNYEPAKPQPTISSIRDKIPPQNQVVNDFNNKETTSTKLDVVSNNVQHNFGLGHILQQYIDTHTQQILENSTGDYEDFMPFSQSNLDPRPSYEESTETTTNVSPTNVGEINNAIKNFEDHNLLKFEHDTAKLTSKYYSLPKIIKENKEKIENPELAHTEKDIFEMAVLRVIKENETILLSGIHQHVVVICKVENDKKIVWAYLTSEKNLLHKKLSDQQPFNYDDINDKPQMIHILTQPFVVYEQQLQQLPEAFLKDGRVIDQHQIGQNYVNDQQENLKQLYDNNVPKKIKDQNSMLPVYNGAGVTLNDMHHALNESEKLLEGKVNKIFSQYCKKRNEGDVEKMEQWLEKQKNNLDKKTFTQLNERIQKQNDDWKNQT